MAPLCCHVVHMLTAHLSGIRTAHKPRIHAPHRLLYPPPRACFASHSVPAGILDVGNAIVAVMRELSPLTIDR